MASRQCFETLEVLPASLESIQNDVTAFELSDVDQQVPGSHTKPCVFSPWPIDSTDNEEFVSHLRAGLQNVLTFNPIVESSNEFPTYAVLAAGGFNSNLFSAAVGLLFPPNSDLNGFRRDEGCPVSTFQANFIRGGLVLTMSLHHMCGDATSIDRIFSLWAASTKAAAEWQPMLSWTPSLDRSYFTASDLTNTGDIESLKKLIKGFSYHAIKKDEVVTHPSPRKMPPLSLQMYHFSTESCTKLKALCKPTDAGKFVSSYDCIAGLTWRCMTRARVPYLKLDPANASTNCAHAVNTRSRFKDKVPNEYFGNGFLLAITEKLPVGQLIGEGSLSRAARLFDRVY